MHETIKNSVFTLRDARGITQEALADAIGVTRQTIIAIERGHYTPSILLSLKIGIFFKKPVESVFSITYEK
jgi:putative transcriptional regulator